MIDRGMMRWAPFSAIKEQFEGLNEIYDKQNEIPMPILDEQQLEEINDVVCGAMSENLEVTISYSKHNKIHFETGNIHYYDTSRNELRVIDKQDKVLYININYITDIKYT
ncbi:YolD-like family protein [Bacillus sp. DX1.1]|uniref:YolD-like family protein n=1 Tax=unclassified Bacillus (in: firmicutes) TaxID=185979 RepID=UPI0025711917|nr:MULTISPECIES: YolD-like family protein [unclassified Bacillus (in: firmicutes)]MDM5152669.1 YolD-like family protein [Bacillus sp. DX1.1]MDM5186142.1 YolD-like family protein [Bacillus sp. DX4.1]WJE84260.1 YolD-like family protein [Bacillus sp. DX3.1]